MRKWLTFFDFYPSERVCYPLNFTTNGNPGLKQQSKETWVPISTPKSFIWLKRMVWPACQPASLPAWGSGPKTTSWVDLWTLSVLKHCLYLTQSGTKVCRHNSAVVSSCRMHDFKHLFTMLFCGSTDVVRTEVIEAIKIKPFSYQKF